MKRKLRYANTAVQFVERTTFFWISFLSTNGDIRNIVYRGEGGKDMCFCMGIDVGVHIMCVCACLSG